MLKAITKRTLAAALIACATFTIGCEKSTSADAEKAKSSELEEEVRELSAKEQIAYLQAQFDVVSALTASTSNALRDVDTKMSPKDVVAPADIDREGAKKFTVFFGANNHGEREDCGCRKNPLGGLGRRATMLGGLAASPPDMKWWEGTAAPQGAVFHVDAGDGFYAHATIARGTPNAQKIAKHDARAVVDALNTFPPDAYLVGELDVPFGVDDIRELAKRAKFPFISANLRAADGGELFPGHVVVERGGVKVAIIGLTKSEARIKDYFTSNGLASSDPLAAAKTELGKLPTDIDGIVLLSNLGMNESLQLVDGLAPSTKKFALAVVSGTNRLTYEPEYASGVPLLEPLSRGKYVGQASFIINGDTISFKNAASSTQRALREYRLAVRSYLTTKKQVLRDRQRIVELQMVVDDVAQRADDSAGTTNQAQKNEQAAGLIIERRKEAIENHKKRLETVEARLETLSNNMLAAVGAMNASAEPGGGDDWIVAKVVPVKIEIDEPPKTRKVLDRAEKSRPKVESAPRLRPQTPPNSALPKGLDPLRKGKGAAMPLRPKTPALQKK